MAEEEAFTRKSLRPFWRGLPALALAWAVAWGVAATFTPPGLLSNELVAIPEMLGQHGAWESRGWLTLVFVSTATLAFAVAFLIRPGRPLVALGAAVAGVVAALVTARVLATNERESQSCANCRTFIAFLLKAYAEANDGWLPRDPRDELAALAKAIPDATSVHFFTSHARAQAAWQEWTDSQSLSPESCCYRYNQGLRLDDPPGLVVLYTARPSTWECSHHPGKEPGRSCYLHPGKDFSPHNWKFLPEAQFQAAQEKTLAFIEARDRQAGAREDVQNRLVLRVAHEATNANSHRFTARLENRGDLPIAIRTLARGSFRVAEIGAQAEFCGGDETMQLPPGGQILFPWWLELELELTMLGDTAVGYRMRVRRGHDPEDVPKTSREDRSWGQGEGTLQQISRASLRERILAEAWVNVEVTVEGRQALPLMIQSPRLPFLD